MVVESMLLWSCWGGGQPGRLPPAGGSRPPGRCSTQGRQAWAVPPTSSSTHILSCLCHETSLRRPGESMGDEARIRQQQKLQMRDRNRGKRGREQPIQTAVNLWIRYGTAAFDFFFFSKKQIPTLENGCVRGEVEFVSVCLSVPFSTTPEVLAVNPFSRDHASTATAELVRNLSVYFKHYITSVCGDGEVTRFSSSQPCVFSKRFQK